ncbi:M56 family metallopeptidase [Mucilaginibacter aquariorum]|uniref:TonB family protein n=1 Tax=Mucilaginibacter aquariorum TaxID=2967225 RepID=A0ABT1T097_9SPHI|nr:M56 family metallopeptidase [Mucilaginibacter aquariorum]MCQ6958007.1 TonB family protein [Mucilaginibacter aquariorum]
MSWLHYLIEANIYLGVFYLCYCLFLNRDTHYMLGRVYLIFSCIMAFILPLTQLSILKPVLPEIQLVAVPTQVTNTFVNVQQSKLAAPVQHFTFDDAIVYTYIAGAVIGLLVLLFRLRKLYILTRNNHSIYKDQYKLIHLNDENTAFSFFNYLFIGSNVPQAETIIAHELVHIRQKHSVDIIFLEVMKIVNWFNPFIYLIQRSLKTIHEYIADEQTAAHEQDALTYSSFLLNNAYGIQGSSIAHSFFNYNLLKKRIIMLNKNRSGKLARLKYLAALPLCAGMLCASTLVFSKDYGVIDLAPRKVVIQKPTADSLTHTLQLTAPDGTKGISDIVVIDNSKTGFKHTYTVNSLTEKDKKELKEKGFDIAIIERTAEVTDTTQQLPVPFPPPPIGLRDAYHPLYKYVHKTVKYPAEALKARKNGMVVLSFNLDVAGKIHDVSVLQSSKTGYDDEAVNALQNYPNAIKDKAGKKIVEVDFWLKDIRAGYLFPNSGRRKPEFIGNLVMMEWSKTPFDFNPPPPPPAPPKLKGKVSPPTVVDIHKTPPPPPPAAPRKPSKVAEVTILPPVKPVTKRPPPPDPTDPAYDDLLKAVARNTRYPDIARANKSTGHVILSLVINSEHKVTDVKVVNGFDTACDAQAARALKAYSSAINKAPGVYKMVVTFMLTSEDNKRFYTPKPLGGDILNAHNFIGEVVVEGFAK